jgi:hypothetical protein
MHTPIIKTNKSLVCSNVNDNENNHMLFCIEDIFHCYNAAGMTLSVSEWGIFQFFCLILEILDNIINIGSLSVYLLVTAA